MNIACANTGEEEHSRFSMGEALEATKHEKMISHLIAFVYIDIHLSQNYIRIHMFYKIKSLVHE